MRRVKDGCTEQDLKEEYIFTGIEHFSSKILLRQMVEYRVAHKDAVLKEHRRQESLQNVDLKRLRNTSMAHSKFGKVKALILAGNTKYDL